ncbi:hypothetical protein ACFXPY_27240, partial [Streptomyces sp. NPDC059153]
MRIRATVAAVSGALALSALAVPAAQAGDHSAANLHKPTSGAEVFGTAAKGSSKGGPPPPPAPPGPPPAPTRVTKRQNK